MGARSWWRSGPLVVGGGVSVVGGIISGTVMPYMRRDSSIDGSRVISKGGISELVSGRGYRPPPGAWREWLGGFWHWVWEVVSWLSASWPWEDERIELFTRWSRRKVSL